MKTRIDLNDTSFDIVYKMSDGNPGAMSVCLRCLAENETIDPDNLMGGLGVLLTMDSMQIYGEDIWCLYRDVCHDDLPTMVAVLRGWQLGLLEPQTINTLSQTVGKG